MSNQKNQMVVLESPFSNSDVYRYCENYLYMCLVARKIMIEQNQSPLFFHALYTQFLHDNIPEERTLGLTKSFNWHTFSDCKLYAIDRGISKGMILGAEDAIKKSKEIVFYTAMPETSFVYKKIEEINGISDIKERWEAGLAFVKNYETEKSELFNSKGLLFEYHLYNEQELQDVNTCLREFFEPLLNHIKNV